MGNVAVGRCLTAGLASPGFRESPDSAGYGRGVVSMTSQDFM